MKTDKNIVESSHHIYDVVTKDIKSNSQYSVDLIEVLNDISIPKKGNIKGKPCTSQRYGGCVPLLPCKTETNDKVVNDKVQWLCGDHEKFTEYKKEINEMIENAYIKKMNVVMIGIEKIIDFKTMKEINLMDGYIKVVKRTYTD